MYAKYQCFIMNTSEDMSQVEVFVTDRKRDGRTDRRMSFNVPRFHLSAGDKKRNALFLGTRFYTWVLYKLHKMLETGLYA